MSFSGVKGSTNQALYPWVRISLGNPILYMIDAFRFGFLGIADVDFRLAFLLVCGFILLLGGVAWWLLSRGVGIKH